MHLGLDLSPRLGPFLRQLRQANRLSQVAVAASGGIDRGTIRRWELGVQRPRLPELRAFLVAVGANQTERHQAHILLGKPDVAAPSSPGATPSPASWGIGRRTHGGDMLRSLRLRGNLSQEEVASRLGITQRTVRRWEQGEIWPNSDHLHRLCGALKASAEETTALTSGAVAFESSSGESSADELYERCQELRYFFTDAGDTVTLRELHFFALEAQTWPLANRSESGQRLLSYIYACHASFYYGCERYRECAVFGRRAMDCFPSSSAPDEGQVLAGIVLAAAAVYGPQRPQPQRGIEILNFWQEAIRWPNYQAWFLSDMANYMALCGDSSGQRLAEQATALALHSGYTYEVYLRQLDEAEIQVKIGKPDQALALLESEVEGAEPAHNVKFHLLAAQAHLKLQSPARSQESLHSAFGIIDNWQLDYLRPQAERLARAF